MTMIVVIISMSLCLLGAWPRPLPGDPPSRFGLGAAALGAVLVVPSVAMPWFEYRDTTVGPDPPLRHLAFPNPWITVSVLLIVVAAVTLGAASRHRIAPAGLVGAVAWLAIGVTSVVFQGESASGRADEVFRSGFGFAIAALAAVSIGAGQLGIARMSRSVDRMRRRPPDR